MSTLQYYRLALLQQMKYQINIQEVLSLQEEINELQNKVALFQRKHRRCDKDIVKHQQCPLCERKYGSEVALKLHLKIKHGGKKESSEMEDSGGSRSAEDKQNIVRN